MKLVTKILIAYAILVINDRLVQTDTAVDGGWSSWKTLIIGPECDKTCGGYGTRLVTQTRECNNPPPSSGGSQCEGSGYKSQVTEQCGSPKACPEGVWSMWSVIYKGRCSATCTGGPVYLLTKRRTCMFLKGIDDCIGPRVINETLLCQTGQDCPDGVWSTWTVNYIGACSATYRGTEVQMRIKRRTCVSLKGIDDCVGPRAINETVLCQIGEYCPVDGLWTTWWLSAPLECPEECKRTRIWNRTCTNPPPSAGGKTCAGVGNKNDTEKCFDGKCVSRKLDNERKNIILIISITMLCFACAVGLYCSYLRYVKRKNKQNEVKAIDEEKREGAAKDNPAFVPHDKHI